MSEQVLILLLQQGNPNAFRHLVENFKDKVYYTCLKVLRNNEDAEDIAQEVFVEVYRSVSHFKSESKLSTWIYRICVTKSLDHLSGKKRKKRFAFVKSIFGETGNKLRYDVPDYINPGIEMERKENAAYLYRAISQLPENQKTAYTLNKIEGMSYQEISEAMQISVSAVESVLFRAKQNLRRLLGGYYQA